MNDLYDIKDDKIIIKYKEIEMYMVNRLRNWQLMIDIMRTSPTMIIEMINSAFEMANLPNPDTFRVIDIVNKCKWVTSQDGLEICLVMHREDLFPPWTGIEKELPEFEEFLKHLDSILDDVGFMVGQKHQLYVSPLPDL